MLHLCCFKAATSPLLATWGQGKKQWTYRFHISFVWVVDCVMVTTAVCLYFWELWRGNTNPGNNYMLVNNNNYHLFLLFSGHLIHRCCKKYDQFKKCLSTGIKGHLSLDGLPFANRRWWNSRWWVFLDLLSHWQYNDNISLTKNQPIYCRSVQKKRALVRMYLKK